MDWLSCAALISCLMTPYEADDRRSDDNRRHFQRLVVDVLGAFTDQSAVAGSGVICGIRRQQKYVAAANHVIRRGGVAASKVAPGEHLHAAFSTIFAACSSTTWLRRGDAGALLMEVF